MRLEKEIEKKRDEINSHYWRFTRQARGNPPPHYLYEELKILEDKLKSKKNKPFYKVGTKVRCVLHGAGVSTEEVRIIEKVDKQGVWLSNGYGNRPSGPFVKGKRKGVYGFWDEIFPIEVEQ